MKPTRQGSILCRYLSGLSEHVFQTCLGIADPSLADYISDLLLRFSRVDQHQRSQSGGGTSLQTLEELLTEARQWEGQMRQGVHRQIGDVALFWGGVFPESLRRGRHQQELEHYRACGKRAYLAASTIHGNDVPGELLARLGNDFDTCASGIHQIRAHWKTGSAGQQR